MDKKTETLLMLDALKTQARGVIKGTTILEDIQIDSFYFVIEQAENIIREAQRHDNKISW